MYPLSVASKSSSEARKAVALDLMARMRTHSFAIVEQVRFWALSSLVRSLTLSQALLVGQELIRVAMLWYDRWIEALEEASRKYKTDNDPAGMIAHLDQLHDLVEGVREKQRG